MRIRTPTRIVLSIARRKVCSTWCRYTSHAFVYRPEAPQSGHNRNTHWRDADIEVLIGQTGAGVEVAHIHQRHIPDASFSSIVQR